MAELTADDEDGLDARRVDAILDAVAAGDGPYLMFLGLATWLMI